MLNLGGFGEGKLMGLAPYGKPNFFHKDFVENWFGVGRRFIKPTTSFMEGILLYHC